MMKNRLLVLLTVQLMLFSMFFVLAFNYKLCVYLLHQLKGQLRLIYHTQSITEYQLTHNLSQKQSLNLKLVEELKRFSVDSLAFAPTSNYTMVYDQRSQAILWVITASKSFSCEPYMWHFPLLGKVSYKGFFIKTLALKEYVTLVNEGYDVDLRPVSAWSTLGWLHDPLLSNMLDRNKGSLCHLLFHELFHATYYAKANVTTNENLAEFIAHKATLRFLANDTSALNQCQREHNDNEIYTAYMLQKRHFLNQYYHTILGQAQKEDLKNKALVRIADSVACLPLHNKSRYLARKQDILLYKNAYFIGFVQYNSLQDSLEVVFNKIYKGKIEKLVQDLKLD